MISSRYKENLLFTGAGILFGIILLTIFSFFFLFGELKEQDDKDTEIKSILNSSAGIDDNSSFVILNLFGFDNDYISSSKSVKLSLTENIKVKIVAKAKIGLKNKTRLEIIKSNKSSYIEIEEGVVVNGLFIKEINDKTLVVENNGVEHVIKLFHPKDINLTQTEYNNDNSK